MEQKEFDIIKKLTSSSVWKCFENVLVVSLLFFCIKFLIEYDNAFYQTWKNLAASRAILSFTSIIFIIRKVKLINWQSLVTTLLFIAVVFERMHYWADAEDILNVIKPQMATEWLSLMIIIDMILYKNVNNLFNGINYLLILYALTAFGMIWRRHDRLDPIVLIFPLFLFALIKMDESKKEWFTMRFIDAWFISYIYIIIKSFTERPYEGSRYYGCFLNIGPFGVFMICCFVVAVSSMHIIKQQFGRVNILYYINCIWLLSIIAMLWIIDTRTTIMGLLFCFFSMFLFVRKNTSKKILVERWLIIAVILIILFISVIVLMKACLLISPEWKQKYSHGLLSPIVHHIGKLQQMGLTDRNMTIKRQLFVILDSLSSGRLRIVQAYSEYFNYDGNGTLSLEIESFNNYFAFSAHNTYVQFLVEYGYISALEVLVLFLFSFILSVKKYINNKSHTSRILPLLWFSALFGVWLGESLTFFYPITFFGVMFITILIPDYESH